MISIGWQRKRPTGYQLVNDNKLLCAILPVMPDRPTSRAAHIHLVPPTPTPTLLSARPSCILSYRLNSRARIVLTTVATRLRSFIARWWSCGRPRLPIRSPHPAACEARRPTTCTTNTLHTRDRSRTFTRPPRPSTHLFAHVSSIKHGYSSLRPESISSISRIDDEGLVNTQVCPRILRANINTTLDSTYTLGPLS